MPKPNRMRRILRWLVPFSCGVVTTYAYCFAMMLVGSKQLDKLMAVTENADPPRPEEAPNELPT